MRLNDFFHYVLFSTVIESTFSIDQLLGDNFKCLVFGQLTALHVLHSLEDPCALWHVLNSCAAVGSPSRRLEAHQGLRPQQSASS